MFIVYIVIVILAFTGLQVYKSINVLGDNLNIADEVKVEVVIKEDAFKGNVETSEDLELQVAKKDLELASLVKTKIIEKPVIVEKEVIKKKIESNINTETLGVFKVSGFCKCSICEGNKVNKDIMSSYAGINVASNSSEIPFGTKVWIEGVGLRQTQPSGQKLTQNEVKVYFKTHEEVEIFGVQEIEVFKVLD